MRIVDPTAEMQSIIIQIMKKGVRNRPFIGEDQCPVGFGQFKYHTHGSVFWNAASDPYRDYLSWAMARGETLCPKLYAFYQYAIARMRAIGM